MLTLRFFSVISCFVLISLSCNKIPEKNNHSFSENASGKLPNDWLFRQRAYPAGKIDAIAYRNAIKHKRESSSTHRNASWIFAGPANIGGRVTDIEIQKSSTPYLFVATASGGIFRTNNNGLQWEPLFDDQVNLSIGDMAIAPTNDQIIYAGTGEANAGGGSIAYDGNGVYRTDDNGDTWIHLGLENAGSIGKVIVHPQDPQVCYVAAMGYLFENNEERGVYKTTDGGQTWDRALFINDSTGIIDLAINPLQPDTIYAAAWERIRRVNRRSYGGPSSGIYRSYDGGSTWSEVSQGLPSEAGRIGIAISASHPEILYAIYAHEITGRIKGLYKSTNYGTSWSELDHSTISEQPFMWWFGKIVVDPEDPNVVYIPSFDMHKSLDGGNTWSTIFSDAHVDQHALCVDPNNRNRIYAGNDGGVYMSINRGESHTKMNGLPNIQFYTCEIDYLSPHRLYGGAQDNNTLRTLTGNTADWSAIFAGDGFRVIVDPTDQNYIYASYQYGVIGKSEDGGLDFDQATAGIFYGDRKNWNTPFVMDPHDPTILYLGTNRMYKTTDRAETWQLMSGDLTRNLEQENIAFGTITAIGISSVNSDHLYIGTDDGLVHRSGNGGESWINITAGLPDRWVTAAVPDPHDINSAYVTYSGYRFGEQTGHIYKTNDQGSSWMDISGNLPDIPVNALIVSENIGHLYIATDIGVFVSYDDGVNWEILGTGLPNLICTDLDYHAEEDLLVVATYGRGLYKINLDEFGVSVNDFESAGFDLQIFPNPISSHSSVTFKTQTTGTFKVSVYTHGGMEIKTIYEGSLSPGTHRFSFGNEKLPVGLYYLSVISAEKGLIKTKTVVKI